MIIQLPVAACDATDCYARQPLNTGGPDTDSDVRRQLNLFGWTVERKKRGAVTTTKHLCPRHSE